MLRSRTLRSLALLALVSTPTLQTSVAADLSGLYGSGPIGNQKVEFASGWYIRGDVGFEQTQSSLDPSALLGGAQTVVNDLRQKHNGYVFSAGAGYKINDWFRVEAMGDIRQDLHLQTRGATSTCPVPDGAGNLTQYESCSSVSRASLTRYDALANAYIDLGTWSSITPYVGAGVGAAFGGISGAVNWYQADGTSYNLTYPNGATGLYTHLYRDTNSKGTYVNFAWAVMAGFAIDVADHLKLDIGYRYFNGGHVPSVTGSGSPLVANEIRAGLRYMVD